MNQQMWERAKSDAIAEVNALEQKLQSANERQFSAQYLQVSDAVKQLNLHWPGDPRCIDACRNLLRLGIERMQSRADIVSVLSQRLQTLDTHQLKNEIFLHGRKDIDECHWISFAITERFGRF